MRAGIAIGDSSAGLYCTIGILMALLEREQSGEGQWVQTSLLQALVAMLDFQAARWLVSQEIPAQAGNNHPTAIPTGVFKTADSHINIAASGNLFERLCKVIGAPELLKHPEFIDFKLRSKNRDALNAAISEKLIKRTSAEWIAAFNKAGVPCGPIYKINEMFADPQIQHIGMAKPVKHYALGEINLVAQGVKLTRTPSEFRTAAPDRGAQSDEILDEFGYSAKDITDLKQRGVV